MSSDRPAQRNAERTKRAILDAASQVIGAQGTAASIADIAKAAGYSKGGVLHHFATRDDLLAALADDLNLRFRAAVLAHLDLSENRPGKMLRAYVRALCGGSAEAMQYFTSSPMWSGVHTLEPVAAVMNADAEWWRDQFGADGLDGGVAHIVQRAAEGIAAAHGFGEETDDSLARGRELLLQLTEQPGPLATSRP